MFRNIFCRHGACDMASTNEWARQAEEGDYLITYASSGLDNDEDPGSRCGYTDSELARIEWTLGLRDLTLSTDDIGLVVETKG